MKVGINQPYLFPYMGYFQLLNEVDSFIFLNDSNYIKKGWINRNSILVDGKAFMFSVPIQKASQNKLICDTWPHPENYLHWWDKFSITIEQSYRKAPHFESIMPILNQVMDHPQGRTISEIAIASIQAVMSYLSIKTSLYCSSEMPKTKAYSAESRILRICELQLAETYINLPGGKDLYHQESFREKGIDLKFIQTQPIKYKQNINYFVPNLSILDALMYNDKETVKKMLTEFSYI